ncbi:MAG TPA: hypothetical protein VMF06_00910 [Candidatus Limnocylindria bacterium]|jgi:hypothetical protein|nr:hypothetical protein [Candidatus Limnocylindria bacterium]
MKTTSVRPFWLAIALAGLTLGSRADLTNVPPDLGLTAPPPITSATAVTNATTTTAPAKAKAKKVVKPTPAKLPGAFSGNVAAVNTNAMTISLDGPFPPRVLTMGSQSHLFRKNKPLTLGQVVVGDHVVGNVHKNAKGVETIINANFSDKKASAETKPTGVKPTGVKPAAKKPAKKPAVVPTAQPVPEAPAK